MSSTTYSQPTNAPAASLNAHRATVGAIVDALSADAPDWAAAAGELSVIGDKIRQYLALRPDIVTDDVQRTQFLTATETMEARHFSEMESVLKRSLGDDYARHFTRIDISECATATIAQVYRAELRDGTPVALKIMKPEVRSGVKQDLTALRNVAEILDEKLQLQRWLGRSTTLQRFADIVEEIGKWLDDELNFENEVKNIQSFGKLLATSPTVKVPRVYADLSKDDVITMEFIDGIPLTNIIAWRKDKAVELRARGIDTDALAKTLAKATLEQIFLHQRFHADPHPGNVIVIPGNRIAYVDFGLVDVLDARFGRSMHRYLQSIYVGDVDGMLAGLRGILLTSEQADWESFRNSFIKAHHTWRRDEDNEKHSVTGKYIDDVLAAASSSGYEIPPSILSMLRALHATDRVAHLICTETGRGALNTAGADFFAQHRWKSLTGLIDPDTLEGEFVSYIEIIREGPKQAYRLLSELAEDKLMLRVENFESPQTRKQGDLRTLLIIAGIVAVSFSMLLAAAIVSSSLVFIFVFSICLAFCYALIFVIAYRLRRR